jgi:quercetin dioxygenase-like cupin family protein
MSGNTLTSAAAPPAAAGDATAYARWRDRQGVPVLLGHHIPDLRHVDVAPWAGHGGSACLINHEDSDRSNDCVVVEIPPGGSLDRDRHLFEEMLYVLNGAGAATVWQDGDRPQTFEWQTGSLFAIPLNANYQLHNGSGSAPARLLAVTNRPSVMNMFADADFVYDCDHVFRSRYDGRGDYFSAQGDLAGRIWQTNFVPDVHDFPLIEYRERGAGGSNVKFKLAGNTMWAHVSEFPVGTYKKAHRHGPGAHVVIIGGTGYSLMWREGEPIKRYDWHEGSLVIPPDRWFHQHFNTGPTPARYLALRYSAAALHKGQKSPMSSVSTRLGGDQIEYEDEEPVVTELFEDALGANGVVSAMR